MCYLHPQALLLSSAWGRCSWNGVCLKEPSAFYSPSSRSSYAQLIYVCLSRTQKPAIALSCSYPRKDPRVHEWLCWEARSSHLPCSLPILFVSFDTSLDFSVLTVNWRGAACRVLVILVTLLMAVTKCPTKIVSYRKCDLFWFNV